MWYKNSRTFIAMHRSDKWNDINPAFRTFVNSYSSLLQCPGSLGFGFSDWNALYYHCIRTTRQLSFSLRVTYSCLNSHSFGCPSTWLKYDNFRILATDSFRLVRKINKLHVKRTIVQMKEFIRNQYLLNWVHNILLSYRRQKRLFWECFCDSQMNPSAGSIPWKD